ncbi:hypothetical protein IWQ62_003756 [Dispira parvispora]|uniref:HhH-GPD domain-containing protein n=1 Tax=Dispira parvispora TaxID=1520584 RepID=A0A9W8E2M3_9FUNG|nr:hypothetical protein IWQ62_003756 [Dispira parvispora]
MSPTRVVRRSARLAAQEGINERLAVSPPSSKDRPRMKKLASKSPQARKRAESPTAPKVTTSPTKPISAFTDSPILAQALQHFAKADPKLAAFMQTVSPPSTFTDTTPTSSQQVFQALVRSIIYQQIHGKAAATIMRRFIKLWNPELPEDIQTWNNDANFIFPQPSDVLQQPQENLRSAGLSARKVSYVLDLADKFHQGVIDPQAMAAMDEESISKVLCQVKGIGQWSADMFLIFHLKRLDVFPVLDLGIRRGMGLHFDLKTAKGTGKKSKDFNHAELITLAEKWKPYRSIASCYMWQVCDVKTVADG